MYAGMAGTNGWGVSDELSWQLTGLGLVTLAVSLVLIVLAPWWNTLEHAPSKVRARVASLNLSILPLFVLGVLRIAADSGFSPYLYFQF